MCCFDWLIGKVAKEKKTGALNKSAESIKVITLLDFMLYWLIDHWGSQGIEERITQQERDNNWVKLLLLVRLCDAALIDGW